MVISFYDVADYLTAPWAVGLFGVLSFAQEKVLPRQDDSQMTEMASIEFEGSHILPWISRVQKHGALRAGRAIVSQSNFIYAQNVQLQLPLSGITYILKILTKKSLFNSQRL